jgi:hypothetical protein
MANKMVTFFGGPSARPDMMDRAAKFAHNMRNIPRKPLRCEIYGTVTAVVDQKHAFNIIAKVLPGIRPSETYEAMTVLQDRLDNA